MATTGYSYQNRASGNLIISGIFFIVSGSLSFILTLLSFWFYIGWFGLFREILVIVASILLIISLGSIGILLPHNKEDIDTSRRWLLIWIILGFVWSFGNLIHPFVSLALLVISVIAGIFAFVRINVVFQILSDTFPSQGKFDSMIYPIFGFYGIVTIIPNIFVSLKLSGFFSLPIFILNILGISISSISFLLLLGVGIMLIQNAQKLAGASFTAVPGVPYAPQIYHKPIEQSGPMVDEKQAVKRFCENCGSKIKMEERFCQNCGNSLT